MASRHESGRSAKASRTGPRPADLERYAAFEAFDRQYGDRGVHLVAGVDEVGRGALAGPVVCAAVVLPPGSNLFCVNDSKKLSENQRERAFALIVKSALSVGIAFGHSTAIDRDNILQTTLRAMHRALDSLRVHPDLVLVDGRDTLQWRGKIVPVTGGDARSLSIAAASIVAKVARDRTMRRLHVRHPDYGFDQNKGYGTRDHLAAIARRGPAQVHRRTFLAKTVDPNLSLF